MTDQSQYSTAPVSADFPEQFYLDPMGVDRYVVQEKVLLSWDAQHSFFYKSSKQTVGFFITSAIIVGLIFLVIQEFLLVGVLGAGVFLLILLSKAPPLPQRCVITTLGIKRSNQYFFWPDLSQFWIEPIQDQYFLYLRQVYPFFQKIKINVTGQDLNQLQKTIGTYLLYKKPQQNMFESQLEKFIHQLPINLNW